MNRFLLILYFSIAYSFAYSQEALVDTAYRQFNTLVATNSVNNIPEHKNTISREVKAISSEQIKLLNCGTTTDLLMNSGTVYVRNIFQGGGSPIIRGFEGSRIGVYVDGVRLNNLLTSTNYSQNMIGVDQNILENIEVVNGPASTIYGSDAMGGVIHMRTKLPELAIEDSMGAKIFNGSIFARYNTANKGQTYHADMNIGNARFASLTSISFTLFDNLRMGNAKNPFSDKMNGRNFYVDSLNGKDSLVKNTTNLIQIGSNYNQYNIVQKFLLKPEENLSHLLNFQFNQSSIIPNYAQLTEMNGNKPKYGVSNIGPQSRFLAAYDFDIVPDSTFFTSLHLGVNMQDVKEGLTNRLFNSGAKTPNSLLDSSLFSYNDHMQILATSLDFINEFEKHSLRYSLDANYNNLTSTTTPKRTQDNTNSERQNAHPLNSNSIYNIGLVASHKWYIKNKLILTDGLRVGFTSLVSKLDSSDFYYTVKNSNITKNVKQEMPVYSVNAGIIYTPIKKLKLCANISTGYRTPNIYDLSLIYKSTAGAVVIPNENLKPEMVYNFDLGATYWYNENIWIENTFFANYLMDAIILAKTNYNGLDSINYYYNAGKDKQVPAPSQVYSQQNAQAGIMYGVSTKLNISFAKYWQITSSVNYTYGKIIKPTEQPMSHIPPVFAQLTAKYAKQKLTLLFVGNFNGTKSLSSYGTSFTEYAMYASQTGTSTWFTLNLNAHYAFNKHWLLQAGVDNILDTQYRTYGSGINASGRNIFTCIRFNW